MVVRLERGESVTVESEGYCGVPGAEVLIVNADGDPQVSMAGSAMSVTQPPAPNKPSAPVVAACINGECGWFGLASECHTMKHDTRLLCPDCHDTVETRQPAHVG